MFGLSWTQIGIIVVIGVFLLGPERIPTAVAWVTSTLRKVRGMAVGAQAELRKEIGPEMEELRRQIAELQSLKEIQELRELRDLHPKRIIGRNLLGEEFSGGVSGFLGLNKQAEDPAADGTGRTTGQNGGIKPVSATPSAAPSAAPTAEPAAGPSEPTGSTAGTAGTPSLTKTPTSGPTSADARPAPAAVSSPPPFDLDGT